MKVKKINFECISCGGGAELFKDGDKLQKHKMSIEVPIIEHIGLKEGQIMKGKKCHKCEKESLIKTK